MMACKITSLVLVVFLIFAGFTESIANKKKLMKKCKRQLGKCSLKNKCFSRRKVREECEGTASPRFEKSLYSNEASYFAPHPLIMRRFPTNWTYSVYLSDDYDGNNLQLVDNCCNLRSGSRCDMPATHNKTKRFFVTFPYNEKKSKRKLYCYHRVPYSDAPIDMCEEGKKIIGSCLDFENGVFKIIYQYTPLHYRHTVLPHDGCYFTMRSDMLPGNVTLRYNQSKPTRIPEGSITVILGEKESVISVAGDPTRHICTEHRDENSKNYETILKEELNPEEGDVVCYKVKSFREQWNWITQRPVYCQVVKVSSRPLPLQVWQVVVPITAFACLIILIGTMRLGRMFHKTTIEAKSGLNLRKIDDNLAITPHTPTPAAEEFCPVEETAGLVTIAPLDNMTSGSADSTTSDDESEKIPPPEADGIKSLTEATARIKTEDETDRFQQQHALRHSVQSTPHTFAKTPGKEIEEACVGSGYMKKHYQMDISLDTPSTTTYIAKCLKKEPETELNDGF